MRALQQALVLEREVQPPSLALQHGDELAGPVDAAAAHGRQGRMGRRSRPRPAARCLSRGAASSASYGSKQLLRVSTSLRSASLSHSFLPRWLASGRSLAWEPRLLASPVTKLPLAGTAHASPRRRALGKRSSGQRPSAMSNRNIANLATPFLPAVLTPLQNKERHRRSGYSHMVVDLV